MHDSSSGPQAGASEGNAVPLQAHLHPPHLRHERPAQQDYVSNRGPVVAPEAEDDLKELGVAQLIPASVNFVCDLNQRLQIDVDVLEDSIHDWIVSDC
mmetsp:Transcript_98148/g.316204  ORF Transcript_98148/g.316204 Transcript_98148/m.316204 type:complete len:98 (-) Transcript_98148:1498-1791(-)